jgi:hypothetical protein
MIQAVPPGFHLLHVLGLGALFKMIDADASSVVTDVTNDTFWVAAIGKLPCCSMSEHLSAYVCIVDHSVATLSINVTQPNPATIRFSALLYFLPESLS